MSKIFLFAAAIFAGISVAMGAFGSHSLKTALSDRALELFETGTRYEMYHALGLLAIALLLSQTPNGHFWLIAAGYAFIVGIFLFSGSLYALSMTGIKGMGAITPLGGIAFLLGWGCLAIAAWSFK
ncbi:MAG: DUF423 domain-containing protein [Desertifilum sp. SIO1I2]|nr:DUF423 domain-containing protein [Desertifilum sp. SIO1I2]